MKLIMFNFEMNQNSQALAFAIDWVNEIAKNVSRVYVITLRCGEFHVRNNVTVYCTRRDKKNKLRTTLSIWKTLLKIHRENNIDGYFIHMAHHFVPVIYPFAKLYNQKIVLWYAHKSIPMSLKIAGQLADTILSVSGSSMRLKTPKFKPMGHGINTDRFTLKPFFNDTIQNIVTVGRISKIKNTHLIVKSFTELNDRNLFLYIVGDTLRRHDKEYLNYIKSLIPQHLKRNIILTGAIPFNKIQEIYSKMDLAINLGDGALDKAVLEPMAMGIPVITSNDTAKELFKHLNNKGVFLIDKNRLTETLKKVISIKHFDRAALREEIVRKHSLQNLAKKVVEEFK